MQFEALAIDSIHWETPDSLVITLADSVMFDGFQSGQHLTIKATLNGEVVYRTYSICQPAYRRAMAIGVRIVPDGLMSNYLSERQKGDSLLVARPHGMFYLRQTDAAAHVLFIAGGSGVTPVISMLEELLHRHPQNCATLLYVNRTLSSTMFLERLMQMKNRFMGRLEEHLFFTREQPSVAWRGCRLNADTLADLAQRGVLHAGAFDAVYLCGPVPMMDSCEAFLQDKTGAIYTEAFGSPLPVAAPQFAAVSSDPIAKVQIIMDGARRDFDFRSGDSSVLDAAKRCGITLPFSCAGGVCGTCRARILDGNAEMTKNYALEPDDISNGFVLSCQAKPTSDTLSLSFDY